MALVNLLTGRATLSISMWYAAGTLKEHLAYTVRCGGPDEQTGQCFIMLIRVRYQFSDRQEMEGLVGLGGKTQPET